MFVICCKKGKIENIEKEKTDQGICLEDILMESETKSKFYKEQCFGWYKDLVVIFNGVLLNSMQLLEKYKSDTILELIEKLYRKGEDFFKEFRGNFNGCIYDVDKKFLLVFSDHLSNRPVFYYENEEYLVISSTVYNIVDFCKKHGKLRLDRGGCYSMITYAYMYHDRTLFDGIKRLLPGWYLTFDREMIEKKQFYKVTTTKKREISIEAAIEKIEELFVKAVKLQAEKNKEYGYFNYAPLSAGMDSRMTVMALKRIHAEHLVNFTYSETGQLDQKLPMQIAKDLGNKWIFKSLDNGLDLFCIDKAITDSDGLIYYGWTSQLGEFMQLVNTEKMGIVHTGVLGDVVLGTYIGEMRGNKKYKIGDGAYSRKLISKLEENLSEYKYENYEIGMMYNRAINGVCLGYSMIFSQYAEACSPFMDIDFLDFCFSLPIDYRLQHKIYYQWVEKYYPEAIKYSHNGLKISNSKFGVPIKGKFIKFDTIPSRVKLMVENWVNKENGMNPTDYWYSTNKELKKYMDNYFEKNKKLKELDLELYGDAKWLYENGNTIEKMLAISLVGSVEKAYES